MGQSRQPERWSAINVPAFSPATLDDYAALVGSATIDALRDQAARLRGARVLHINATSTGGGVAELLLSLIPLMRDAGLAVDWFVMDAEPAFFEVTKAYHNALQGKATSWSDASFATFQRGSMRNAERLAKIWGGYDFVVVHDPQPLLLRPLLGDAGARWFWRCHIDLTAPAANIWDYLSLYLTEYDRYIFSLPEYVPQGLAPERTVTALPAIDPFRAKNSPIDKADVAEVIAQYGIDASRPYVLQVSRFDPWKDPVGVLEAYRLVKSERRDVQLVYMAAMAGDDPEGVRIYEDMKGRVRGDDDVHLLALDVPPSQTNRNAYEVNALQRGAAVILQKSIREGFGLTVAEALWKSKPVVAGNTGGIRCQIRDGVSGFLVDSAEECAMCTMQLLNDPALARTFGARGHEDIRRKFLFTRLLGQYLDWFTSDFG